MKIKNWEKFQHFKDRRLPWIKLYRDILDDPDWFDLRDKDARLLVHLWLLASEDKTMTGTLPDTRTIAFRLRTTEKDIVKGLQRLSAWLYPPDIKLISGGYQVDAPETETEKRKRERQRREIPPRVIDYLNKKTNKNFRKIDTNIDLIKILLNKGFVEEDFYKAIDNQVAAWANDEKMSPYLRPKTLFGPKFDGYVNNGKIVVQQNTCQLCAKFCVPSSPDKCHKSATIKACKEFAAR